MVRQLILAGIVVFLPAGVQAQGRGAMPPVSHAAAAAPRVVTPAPHVGTAQPIRAPHAGVAGMPVPGTRPVTRNGAARPRTTTPVPWNARGQVTRRRRFDDENTSVRPGCNSAPGLGFDAVHQAATCGSGAVGCEVAAWGSLFFPFLTADFPAGVAGARRRKFWGGDGTAGSHRGEVRERERRHRVIEPVAAPAPAVETASSAPTDDEQFVFVRRDGTVFLRWPMPGKKGHCDMSPARVCAARSRRMRWIWMQRGNSTSNAD